MKLFKSKSGFTLIELLVVIGILAVLAAIAIPSVAGLIDRANVSADKTNANEMTNAMERFAAEYELYCQDIASGVIKADTTDFDAAQGRVYNVTGALSRSDIETLEVAQGATVADDQIAIYRDTKYPVNAMTAKSIVMNYTKTSSSTFEPKQSDMHFWYSPDCGVVIFAEPNADVVTQLNVQILSGKDAKGNELGASTKWIDLTADTTVVVTHAMLNKTDVLDGCNTAYFRSEADFDNFVAVKVDGNVVDGSNYTLSEGSTVVVLKPEYVQTLSDGEHTMEIQSTDGSATCNFKVKKQAQFIMVGKNYTLNGLYFLSPFHTITFNEDMSINVKDVNGNQLMVIPSSSVTVYEDGFELSNTGMPEVEMRYYLRENGKYITYATGYSDEEDLFAYDANYPCRHKPFMVNGKRAYGQANCFFVNAQTQEDVTIEEVFQQKGANIELVCARCAETIDFFVQGNYIYTKGVFVSPQSHNGGNASDFVADTTGENYDGWYATPYDTAYVDGMLESINGEPIVFMFPVNGSVIPSTVEGVYYPFINSGNPTDVEMTYRGTQAQFKTIIDFNGTSFYTELVNMKYTTIKTITIHCTDGDLVIQK